MSIGVVAASYVESAPSLPYVDEVLADGPDMYWRLGDAVGTTVLNIKDSSGKMPARTPISGSGSAPDFGFSGAIHGDSDTASRWDTDVPVLASPSGGGTWWDANPQEISWEFWTRSPTSPNGWLVHRNTLWELRVTSTQVIWRLLLGSSTWYEVDYTHTFGDDAWHHVVVTYKRGGDGMRIYADGALVSWMTSNIPNTNRVVSQFFNVLIGRNNTASLGYYVGDLDELAFYNIALSPERVAAHYAAGID